jgi:hypothetical protein
MRQISKAKGSFAFTFMSYSRSRGKSLGIVEVPHARLRAQEFGGSELANHMLNYVDIDTGEAFHFWQPCLMYFEGKKITL